MDSLEILLCEGERTVALDIERRLEHIGHIVRGIASNGSDAISLAEELKPNLTIMDIGLDGKLSGIEVARVIKDRFNIPSIYLTALSEPQLIGEAINTGTHGYILKPVCDAELYTAINMGISMFQKNQKLEKTITRHRSQLVMLAEKIGQSNTSATFTPPYATNSRQVLNCSLATITPRTYGYL